MNRHFIILTMGLLLLAAGCGPDKNTTMITDLLKEAKAKLAPDKRTVVFDVEGELRGKTLTLRGDLHSAQLKEQLFQFLKGKGDFQIADSIEVLPQKSLGAKTFAVVSVSVANLRTKHEHGAEMGTQAILGTPLKVLKKERGGWFLVQTPDEYLGWTDDMIVGMTPEEYRHWTELPKVIVTAEFGFTRQGKAKESQVVSDVVAGALFGLKKDDGSHFEVVYPDGRTAYLSKEHAEPFSSWLAQAKDTPESIVATAKRFFGVPYLWGGTSAKALDCSGFTKTVYYLNGVLLPRDASQQALVGDPVEITAAMDNVKPGDLLFFGKKAKEGKPERVTHVAISLGGKRFIHESGDVRFNSLDPADPDYAKNREESFLSIKRIIGAGEQAGIRRLAHMPYYRGNE